MHIFLGTENNVSIMGKHDLSTTKKEVNGKETRVSSRAIQNRKARDIIAGTTEEHNEAVMNGVYPNYIVCFDKITPVAVQKMKMLQEEYNRNGINQKVELLVVDGEKEYISKSNDVLVNNMNTISQEIEETGTISQETFEQFFNKRERNLTLQTVQSINSTSYRDNLWDNGVNKSKLDVLTDILEKAGKVAPQEYLGDIASQVEFLIRKSDRNDKMFGYRVYDHSFADSIDVDRLEEIKMRIQDRIKGIDGVDVSKEEERTNDGSVADRKNGDATSSRRTVEDDSFEK